MGSLHGGVGDGDSLIAASALMWAPRASSWATHSAPGGFASGWETNSASSAHAPQTSCGTCTATAASPSLARGRTGLGMALRIAGTPERLLLRTSRGGLEGKEQDVIERLDLLPIAVPLPYWSCPERNLQPMRHGKGWRSAQGGGVGGGGN